MTRKISKPVIIRPANESDLSAAGLLERSVFTQYAISPRQMRFLLKSANSIFLVAVQEKQLAGDAIAIVRRHKGGRLSGRIYSLVVDSKFRGTGIGRKLLAALFSKLVQAGAGRIYLEVESTNLTAIRLYEAHGFHPHKHLKNYYSRGKHGVQMRWGE